MYVKDEKPKILIKTIRTEMSEAEKGRALDLVVDLLVKMYLADNVSLYSDISEKEVRKPVAEPEIRPEEERKKFRNQLDTA
jgi:hypothetical protein